MSDGEVVVGSLDNPSPTCIAAVSVGLLRFRRIRITGLAAKGY